MEGLAGVVSVANSLFEQFDGRDFDHMLGEICAELQGKGTDENGILKQRGLYGKKSMDGPLPDCLRTGRLGMLTDGWQQRLALMVGRKIIHAGEG